jgi:TRAP-type C4-dicarboxylate transport system permease small subunit
VAAARIWADRIEHAMAAVDTVMGLIGGSLFFVAAWYIVIDVLGRNYTGFYSGGTDEISGYALAIGTTWAMAFALRRKGHVAIDIVTAHLPERVRPVLELVALAVMLLFAGLLARFAWGLAIGSAMLGERSVGIIATPLAIPQTVMAIGFTALAVEALVLGVVGALRLPDQWRGADATPNGRQAT